MKRLLVLAILISLPIPTWAIGEDDPLWNKPTYEKKIAAVGKKLLDANGISEHVVFRIGYRTSDEKNNVNAQAEEGHAQVTVENGILKYIENDDQLAFILGHEIAHVTHRHSSKLKVGSRARTLLITTPLTVAGAVGGIGGVYLGNRLGHSVNKVFTNSKNRSLETEADITGVEYMIKAGYDPQNAILLSEKIFGDGSASKIWRSHPLGSERIKAISEYIATKIPQSEHSTAETLSGEKTAKETATSTSPEVEVTTEAEPTEEP